MEGREVAEGTGVLRTAPEAFEPLGFICMPDTIGEVFETVAVDRQIPTTKK